MQGPQQKPVQTPHDALGMKMVRCVYLLPPPTWGVIITSNHAFPGKRTVERSRSKARVRAPARSNAGCCLRRSRPRSRRRPVLRWSSQSARRCRRPRRPSPGRWAAARPAPSATTPTRHLAAPASWVERQRDGVAVAGQAARRRRDDVLMSALRITASHPSDSISGRARPGGIGVTVPIHKLQSWASRMEHDQAAPAQPRDLA